MERGTDQGSHSKLSDLVNKVRTANGDECIVTMIRLLEDGRWVRIDRRPTAAEFCKVVEERWEGLSKFDGLLVVI